MDTVTEQKFTRQLQDLNPVLAGMATCSPGSIRMLPASDHMLLCYVLSGRGSCNVHGHFYQLSPGLVFLLPPSTSALLTADTKDFLVYQWVGFTGTLVSQFQSLLPPVFPVNVPIFPHLQGLSTPTPNLDIDLIQDLMMVYIKYVLPKTATANRSNNHIKNVIYYIKNNYAQPLTIQQIADHIGLNRGYLSKIFKDEVGISIQTHLLQVRIAEAKRCLEEGCSVDETRILCGFNSLTNFSRQFSKHVGISPNQWKKLHLRQHID